MKLAQRFIATASLCAFAATLSLAPISANATLKNATKWPQICPMSGTKIASLKDAAGEATYKGKTYYFCCPMCKPAFVKDPAKYVAMASKHKYALSM